MLKRLGVLLCALWLAGCATSIPPAERQAARDALDAQADAIVQRIVEETPRAARRLEEAEGFFTAQVSGASVVIAGGGYGTGRLVDLRDDTRTYMNIGRIDLGPGIGAATYSTLIVFHDREVMERFREGQVMSAAGAKSGVGQSSSATVASNLNQGVSVYTVSESGAVANITGRLIRVSVNNDLTDTGLSEVSVPATGLRDPGRQVDGAPRQWDRALPFLAQEVIDQGYDLPLPYGIGLIYANVDQDQILKELDVGFNGGPKEPYEFVGFENAVSLSDTLSLRADAWLFPFMNVYAMIGHLEGDADLDVLLDGNGMLEQLGEDCSRPIPSLTCLALQDRIITLPIETKFDGTTYGLGMNLAGGWNNFFVVLAFNATYADMSSTVTDGLALTFSPRGGYLFKTDNWGTVALFVGANYLETELEVKGSVSVPETDLSIDYTVQQENADRWNTVVGLNWDLSRRWAVSGEFNGFSGSREAVIFSLTRRF